MELQSEERKQVSKEYAKRTMVGYFLVYSMLIAMPLLLTGNAAWALFALILFAVVARISPGFFAPNQKQLERLMYNDSHDQMRADNPMGVEE